METYSGRIGKFWEKLDAAVGRVSADLLNIRRFYEGCCSAEDVSAKKRFVGEIDAIIKEGAGIFGYLENLIAEAVTIGLEQKAANNLEKMIKGLKMQHELYMQQYGALCRQIAIAEMAEVSRTL